MADTADLAALTADAFEPRMNDTFTLHAADRELPLRLASVKRLGPSKREGGGFSLVFVAAPGPSLPQAIYPIVHPELGCLDLFVVPIGPQAGGIGYEAVFT
jgi:hypothetical protein